MIPQVVESDYLWTENKSFTTRAIHVGQHAEAIHGSVNVPIHLSTTFKQPSPGVCKSQYDYTRCGNPTRSALEECLANLENNKYAIGFSSGCAAMSAIVNLVKTGEQIICCDDVYGGTQRYLRNFTIKNHGIQVDFVDMTNPETVAKAITPLTKLIWIETPTNPTLKVIDIKVVCKLAKDAGIISVVDDTFATPLLQTPSDLGADITVNSGTKYLGGHSDVIFGSLTTSDKDLYDRLHFSAKSAGGCPSVFDCFLIQRSLKTLELRVKAATRNAYILAKYLEAHPQIEKVIYPGLKSHPQHALIRQQMRGSGAMMSFYVKGGFKETSNFLQALKVFTLAESLGGVESLIELPAVMTHGSVPVDHRKLLGITDNMVRVSVGIENIEDLIQDIEAGLLAAKQ